MAFTLDRRAVDTEVVNFLTGSAHSSRECVHWTVRACFGAVKWCHNFSSHYVFFILSVSLICFLQQPPVQILFLLNLIQHHVAVVTATDTPSHVKLTYTLLEEQTGLTPALLHIRPCVLRRMQWLMARGVADDGGPNQRHEYVVCLRVYSILRIYQHIDPAHGRSATHDEH